MKRCAVLIACFMIMNMGYASAESESEIFRKHGVELGTEISHIAYEEPDFMKDSGFMYGIIGSYAYHNIIMIKADGRLSYGKMDYSSTGTGEADNIDDYLAETRGVVGYDFLVYKILSITPYMGIGYRYLKDDSSGITTTTGARGYERESNYIYSPIGLEISVPFANDWQTGTMLEYDYFWWGKQKSHLSDAISGLGDIENKQTRGWGLRGAVKIEKRTKKIDFIIESFARYWSIERSKKANITFAGVAVGYGIEPKNNSIEYGVKLAWRF